MRNPRTLHTAVWDAGYEGRGEDLLEVGRPIEIEAGAHFAQFVLATADHARFTANWTAKAASAARTRDAVAPFGGASPARRQDQPERRAQERERTIGAAHGGAAEQANDRGERSASGRAGGQQMTDVS